MSSSQNRGKDLTTPDFTRYRRIRILTPPELSSLVLSWRLKHLTFLIKNKFDHALPCVASKDIRPVGPPRFADLLVPADKMNYLQA